MKDIKNTLKWYEQMGVNEINLNQPGMLITKEEKIFVKKQKLIKTAETDLIVKARSLADQCKTLEQLRQIVTNFDELSIAKTATNTVFSDGSPNASIMAIGEAPGANEDEEGIPFCGVSGKLLDQVLLSIGLNRATNLYITNSIFWRPPGNRKPTLEENAVCLPFVEKHIALLKPKLILLVGSTAASSLLESTETISRLRSKFYQYENRYLSSPIPVAVIFHPSYLLRQSLQKKTVWFDLLKIKKTFLSDSLTNEI
jgi:uracil-DNA glycosylase family 4